jgi:peptide/nickel transport system permease protein
VTRRRGLIRVGAQLGQSLLTVTVVAILVFLLVRLVPGDPVTTILGTESTPEAEAALRAQLHLDDSIPEQFRSYVAGLFRGDLGNSAVERGTSVSDIIGAALPTTLSIVLTAMVLATLVGVGLGLTGALSRRRGVDVSVRTGAMLLYATPTFLVALVLILVFSLSLGWFPAGGWAGSWPENAEFLVLPAIALSSHLTPVITRTVRQSAIQAGGQQYVEAAYVRGLSPWALKARHILPNSILPVVTLLGLSFGGLITGAIIVEAVFGLPGLGAEMVKAVARRDYPVIQGIALVTAVAVVLGNLLAEIAYTVVDPRARRA